MASPESIDTGKGKAKARPRLDADGKSSLPSVAATTAAKSLAETTPRPGEHRERPCVDSSATDKAGFATRLFSQPPEWPKRRTMCLLAVIVWLLALGRAYLLPKPQARSSPAPTVSVQQQEELVRLVLAEQMAAIADQVEFESRYFEELRERHSRALKELKDYEEKVNVSASEVRELEGLGKVVHEENAGDADLSTEVVRAQQGLRDLHRDFEEALAAFRSQLDAQAETLREARRKQADRAQEAVDHTLQERSVLLLDALRDLGDEHAINAEGVNTMEQSGMDVLRGEELQVLLEEAVANARARMAGRGSDSADHMGDARRAVASERARLLARASVDRILGQRRTQISGDGGGEMEEGGSSKGACVHDDTLNEEIEEALERHRADGTGLMDYANRAVGGVVITSDGLTSETFTPTSSWLPSGYWHRVGVENGVGSVDSVLSEDTSLGSCWAMNGAQGQVTIKLPRDITVDGVSVEHASRMVTLESNSAPRVFEVYGLRGKHDMAPVKLLAAEYELEGRSIQTFPVTPLGRRFGIIQFKVLSNWGNPDYTCLYRLRVHGREAL